MELLKQKKQVVKGFSLIEVLIFITISSLILITGIQLSLNSVNRIKTNQYKTIANYFTNSLFEWLQGEKEKDWELFLNKSATNQGRTYCFNRLNITYWPSPRSCGTNFSLGANELFNNKHIFKREANLKTINQESVLVTVTVYWKEKNTVKKISATRTMNFIEK